MNYFIINETVRKNAIKELHALPLNRHEVRVLPIKRSLAQNRMYWNWCEEIGTYYNGKDAMHRDFAAHFLGVDEFKTYFGQTIIQPKSTSKLNKKQFCEYLNKIQLFAEQQEITITDPSFYGMEIR